MANTKKRTRLKSLSHGRPPSWKSQSSMSRKATRNLIRTHHTLEKQKAQAVARGDESKSNAISQEIESQGGIESYQSASLLGQAYDRGGDSSKILLSWLEPRVSTLKNYAAKGEALRMLEVGALSTTNACSSSQLFKMSRIDLRSTIKDIVQQDFMKRPPRDETERFHIISLSLVLNYVPDPVGRGDMLSRTLDFLTKEQDPQLEGFFPSLFLVLPVRCVTNSRYMDEGRLEAIMESLGYSMVKKKLSTKLIYYLWTLEMRAITDIGFKKEKIRPGMKRNNFSIVRVVR